MKASIFIVLYTLLVHLCFAQSIHIKSIEYDVQIRNTDCNDDKWYQNNIEASGRTFWIRNTVNAIKKGGIKVYDIDNIEKELTLYDVNEILDSFTVHEVTIYDRTTGQEISQTVRSIDSEVHKINHIRFREDWWMDTLDFTIQKRLVAFSFLITTYEDNNKHPLFWVKPELNQYPIWQITPCIQYSVTFDNRDPSDSSINHRAFGRWTNLLTEALKSEMIYGYNDTEFYPAQFFEKWDYQSFASVYENPDTLAGPDPMNYDDPQYIIIPGKFEPHISGLAFRETWHWDDKNGLVKKIIAYAPIMDIIDDQGNFRGTAPLCWIK